jgi:hypothetical protein
MAIRKFSMYVCILALSWVALNMAPTTIYHFLWVLLMEDITIAYVIPHTFVAQQNNS